MNLLFKKKISVENILLYHSYEKSLLPDILYENYLQIINKFGDKNSTSFSTLNMLENITENYSIADNIDTAIKKEHIWDLFENHGMLTCFNIKYYMEKIPKRDYQYIYPKQYSFLSTERSYKKIYKKINNNSLNTTYSDNINNNIVKNIILSNLFNDNITIVENQIINYNFELDDIERLIKFSEKYSEIYKNKLTKKKYKTKWKLIIEKLEE